MQMNDHIPQDTTKWSRAFEAAYKSNTEFAAQEDTTCTLKTHG